MTNKKYNISNFPKSKITYVIFFRKIPSTRNTQNTVNTNIFERKQKNTINYSIFGGLIAKNIGIYAIFAISRNMEDTKYYK